MSKLRKEQKMQFAGIKIIEKLDYQALKKINFKKEISEIKEYKYPTNAIKFILENEIVITVRPSGTEPKIKFYISVKLEYKEKHKIFDIINAIKMEIKNINITENLINLVEIDSKEIARKNKNKEVSIWHLLMSIITTPKKSEIKFIDTKTLKNIKQEVLFEIDKLEKILIEKNEIIIPKINKEIFALIKEAKKEFKSKPLIGAKEIFYQILKNKKLLKKYKLSKSTFDFKDQNVLEYMEKIK